MADEQQFEGLQCLRWVTAAWDHQQQQQQSSLIFNKSVKASTLCAVKQLIMGWIFVVIVMGSNTCCLWQQLLLLWQHPSSMVRSFASI
jgi:hypothetical protein